MIDVYSEGVMCACVCSDLSQEEVIEHMKTRHRAGETLVWELSEEPFATGEPNPCPCDTLPGCKHYLFYC